MVVMFATPEILLPNSAGMLPVYSSIVCTIVGIDGISEGAGELVADGHPVHDVRHLVVGSPRVYGAVGVCRKSWKAQEHRLKAARANRRRHAFDYRCKIGRASCRGGG